MKKNRTVSIWDSVFNLVIDLNIEWEAFYRFLKLENLILHSYKNFFFYQNDQ